ncbi:MAG: DUF47 domain-containing protein [Methanolinea tarda]|nr:DUF47 family protein [Methanolinea sp.]
MKEGTFIKKVKKKGLFQMIFPEEYDFEAMLAGQAEKTVECVEAFVQWLKAEPVGDPAELRYMAATVDGMRYGMEEKLMDSFSTPFDRQDIYTLSRQMDYIVNYSYETAREMYAFGVEPDIPIVQMAGELLRGTKCMAAGVTAIGSDTKNIEKRIRSARQAMHTIDDIYIESMARLFQTKDAMGAMKKREVYHHMRDAGRALRATVDTLHHVVVGIS